MNNKYGLLLGLSLALVNIRGAVPDNEEIPVDIFAIDEEEQDGFPFDELEEDDENNMQVREIYDNRPVYRGLDPRRGWVEPVFEVDFRNIPDEVDFFNQRG